MPVDDLDGKKVTKGGETAVFAVDGVSYEIDLKRQEREEAPRRLRHLYPAWPASQRSPFRCARSAVKAKSDKAQLTVIRQWVRDKGFDVADRGRVSREIKDADSTDDLTGVDGNEVDPLPTDQDQPVLAARRCTVTGSLNGRRGGPARRAPRSWLAHRTLGWQRDARRAGR